MTVAIFFINLASRLDRSEFMAQQFAALGLSALRVDAQTPAGLTPEQLRRCEPHRIGGPTATVLCCTLSHLAAIAELKRSGASHALILEDDAVLSPHLPAFLEAFERTPLEGLVRIETSMGGVRYRRARGQIGELSIYRPLNWEGGSAGYIVSATSADAVLARIKRDIGYDEAIFNPFGRLRGHVPLYQTVPALVVQSHLSGSRTHQHFGSDISAGPDPSTSVLARFARRASSVYRRDIVYGSQRTLQQWLGAKKHKVPFAD